MFRRQAKQRNAVTGLLPVDEDEFNRRQLDAEYEGPRRRLPRAIIIGASKCGTEALEFFLQIHPDIATERAEINFFAFDDMYKLGYDWLRLQMPISNRTQITLNRGTAYFDTPGVPERIQSMNESMRLILVVCNPVKRIQSWYTHMFRHGQIEGHFVPPFTETFFYPNGTIRPRQRAIYSSNYALLIKNWTEWFNQSQIHIVVGDRLKLDPLKELKQIEDFLGIRNYINDNHIVYNELKGFYCRVVNKVTEEEECLGPNKGRTQIEVPQNYMQRLDDFFMTHNKRFYKMFGENLNWQNITIFEL